MQGHQVPGLPPAFAERLEGFSQLCGMVPSAAREGGRGAECAWGVTKRLLCLQPHGDKGRTSRLPNPLPAASPFPCSPLTQGCLLQPSVSAWILGSSGGSSTPPMFIFRCLSAPGL